MILQEKGIPERRTESRKRYPGKTYRIFGNLFRYLLQEWTGKYQPTKVGGILWCDQRGAAVLFWQQG